MPQKKPLKHEYTQEKGTRISQILISSMQTETIKSQVEKIAQIHYINLNNSNLNH